MLEALLDCFKDESWPVRDCACLACGHFVATFPEESKSVFEELCQLWFNHLGDNIQSVREHSSQALIEIIKAGQYKTELEIKIKDYVKENIKKAKDQKSESAKFSGLQNETQFGVAKPINLESMHDQEHQNNTMFSCGSLAPKLKRGGGCMDHGFQRP